MSRLIRLRLGLAAIIPEELSRKLGLQEGQEVIVKESKFGIFINPLKVEERERIEFTKEEIGVIDKLLSMKFIDRTPENVSNELNAAERRILSDLIERKAVNLFKSQKYKEGVYNVRDSTYDIVKRSKGGKAPEKTLARPVEKAERIERKQEMEETDPIRKLEKIGFLVIDNQNEAKRLSDEIASRGRKSDVTGIRGFDKKYYILKASFFGKNQPKISNVLKGGKKTLDQIAEETGLDKQACTGILAMMNEAGDVVEKKRGIFILSD